VLRIEADASTVSVLGDAVRPEALEAMLVDALGATQVEQMLCG
jgi:hypothetical protein